MSTEQVNATSPEWHVGDETLGRVALLIGVKADAGMVLDFQEMEDAGELAGCSTTGAFAIAWLRRKLSRVEYLTRPAEASGRNPGWYWVYAGDEWEPARFSAKGWEPAMSASTAYFSDEAMGEIGPRIFEPALLNRES